MTYNIHHGVGTDKKLDLSRIAEVIKISDADIIGLNEVDKHYSKRSNYENQIIWLAKELHMDHAFAPSITLKSNTSFFTRQFGNALLSRYPIITQKVFPFNFIRGVVEGRSLLDATVQVYNKQVKIYVTHLSINPFLHHRQTNYMIKSIQDNSHPLIIMGDWNMRPGSKGWKNISHKYKDVWCHIHNGGGYTYPSQHPRYRLDYIFVNHRIKIMDVEVIRYLSQASDHLPLKAQLCI